LIQIYNQWFNNPNQIIHEKFSPKKPEGITMKR